MPGFPAIGTLSYAGYTFDGATRITARAEPVFDPTGRTVMSVKIRIDVLATISATDDGTADTDDRLEWIRAALSEQGKDLIFINKGFGDDLQIGAEQPVHDIDFGPKPEIISWKPIGSSLACEVQWAVTTTISECGQGSHPFEGVMAMNYTVSSRYDGRGDLSRSIQGFIQIANNIVDKKLLDSPDLYRDRYSGRAGPDFRRTNNTWTLNEAKNRVNFNITDEQIASPNPYPGGAISASGSQKSSWSMANGKATSYRVSLNMTIDPARHMPSIDCWNYFQSVVFNRRESMVAAGAAPLLDTMDVTENLFGFPIQMSVSFNVLRGKLSEIFAKTALYTPLPGVSWAAWQASVSDHMFSNSGNPTVKSLLFMPSDDILINLCGGQPTDQSQASQPLDVFNVGFTAYSNTKPPADQSFLQYDMRVITMHERPVAHQFILKASSDVTGTTNMRETGPLDFGQEEDPKPIVQTSGDGYTRVRLIGKIKRAGYTIPKPKIESVMGASVEETGGFHELTTVGDSAGVPIVQLRTVTDYVTTSKPGTIKPPQQFKDELNMDLVSFYQNFFPPGQ